MNNIELANQLIANGSELFKESTQAREYINNKVAKNNNDKLIEDKRFFRRWGINDTYDISKLKHRVKCRYKKDELKYSISKDKVKENRKRFKASLNMYYREVYTRNNSNINYNNIIGYPGFDAIDAINRHMRRHLK